MKSKTSCYDPALSRMAIRRFAAVVPLYLVGVLVCFLASLPYRATAADQAYTMRGFLQSSTVIQFAYAFVLVQLLFGDLYSPRLCYSLRAMPVTDGGYYGTQIILGLGAWLLPNAVLAAVMACVLGEDAFLALWWLEAAGLQFLLCFGGAVVSAVCAGNRVGMTLLDGILNFAAVLVYWFVHQIYEPLLYGVSSAFISVRSPLLQLSPVEQMVEMEYLEVLYRAEADGAMVLDRVERTGDWLRLGIYGAVGIVLLVLGMKLFRHRRAECAGSLLAFSRGTGLFLLLFTLTVGGFFHVLASMQLQSRFAYPLLFVGLTVGYFAGCMLLERQMRVLRRKNFAGWAGLLTVIAVSLVLTGMDCFGICSAVPDAEQVASVTVENHGDGYTAQNTEEIREVIDIQQTFLAEHDQRRAALPLPARLFYTENYTYSGFKAEDGNYYETAEYTITYRMKDGSSLVRVYPLSEVSSCYGRIGMLLSQPRVVLNTDRERLEEYLPQLKSIRLQLSPMYEMVLSGEYEGVVVDRIDLKVTEPDELERLMECLIADCESGVMAQDWLFQGHSYRDIIVLELQEGCKEAVGTGRCSRYIHFNTEAENLTDYLQERGYRLREGTAEK